MGKFVFCRGCGKEIHESAPACPQCGAPQAAVNAPGIWSSPHWSSVVSLVTGIAGFILSLTGSAGSWSADEIAGGLLFSALPIGFGVVSLSKKHAGRGMAMAGLVLGGIVLSITLGSL